MTTSRAFGKLGLDPKLLPTLTQLGYEQASPIQADSIPVLMTGKDLIAQAQTGTGKTAAFALPILSRLKLSTHSRSPQTLVLTPTRELAIQVAEAFQSYAKGLSGFYVLPIYGGQGYQSQLKALKRGVHVVVGTPGRIIDHFRRGTLTTTGFNMVVLDEADEMLNMGFIEDIQWILEQIHQPHQTALFSATIPKAIQKIAQRFLKEPVTIQIEPAVKTVTSINQSYMVINKKDKLAALTRYLEIETIDAAIIFTGTKVYSMEVAEKLQARGYRAAALHGDMSQSLREQVIAKLKKGDLDIVVATEVAARGLDLDRITHVINFDVPQAPASYIHRIGRTGRAGRTGHSLLLVTPREQRLLRAIQVAVENKIQVQKPPSADEIQSKRAEKLTQDIIDTLRKKDIHYYKKLIKAIVETHEVTELDVAAAITHLAYQEQHSADLAHQDIQFSDLPEKQTHYKKRKPKPRKTRQAQPNASAKNFLKKKKKQKRYKTKETN